jgi:nitrogen regulatory protein PII
MKPVMKLLVLILREMDKLDVILRALQTVGASGATVMSSQGIGRKHAKEGHTMPVMGTQEAYLSSEREHSKTILCALDEDRIPAAIYNIEKILGDLTAPDKGLLLVLSIEDIKGIRKWY